MKNQEGLRTSLNPISFSELTEERTRLLINPSKFCGNIMGIANEESWFSGFKLLSVEVCLCCTVLV